MALGDVARLCRVGEGRTSSGLNSGSSAKRSSKYDSELTPPCFLDAQKTEGRQDGDQNTQGWPLNVRRASHFSRQGCVKANSSVGSVSPSFLNSEQQGLALHLLKRSKQSFHLYFADLEDC